MLRRTYLHVLSSLSVLPELIVPGEDTRRQDYADTLALSDEGDLWFWYYVYLATQRERVMSTERSRERAVNEMNLTHFNDAETQHILEQANDGEITLDDMPDQWRRVLSELDQVPIT